MIQHATETLSELYEADETAWLEAMAELIRNGSLESLDYSHLGEYLEDMARRDRREVESRLRILIAHLLKWTHQPEHRSSSWSSTILAQQQDLCAELGRGVLRNHAISVLEKVYADGLARAITETGLQRAVFPVECPYTLDQLLNEELSGS